MSIDFPLIQTGMKIMREEYLEVTRKLQLYSGQRLSKVRKVTLKVIYNLVPGIIGTPTQRLNFFLSQFPLLFSALLDHLLLNFDGSCDLQ